MIRKLVAAAALAVAFAGPAFAQSPVKLRVGVEGNYPPFSQIAPDGKLSGFDIDIANAVCAEMKAECTLVQQEFDGIIPALNAKKFDMIVASMTITEERKNLCLNRYIKRRSRFISNQYLRVTRDCHSNHHPLELTTRKLMRVAV